MTLCTWQTEAMAERGGEPILRVDGARRLGSFGGRTRDVPVPSDSYAMLGELRATIDSLEEACRRLGVWHTTVEDGVHYAWEDDRGDGATGTVTAAIELETAAGALNAASGALSRGALRERRGPLVRQSSLARPARPVELRGART